MMSDLLLVILIYFNYFWILKCVLFLKKLKEIWEYYNMLDVYIYIYVFFILCVSVGNVKRKIVYV